MLLSLLSLLWAARVTLAGPAPAPQNFVNTAITRNIELGGAVTSYSTQYSVKALKDTPGEYHLVLARPEDALPAWWEVQVGGEVRASHILGPGGEFGQRTCLVYLGDMKKGDTATISLSLDIVHASVPLPAEIEQRDPQYLLWKTNATYVESWYPTDVERIKIRSPTPNIVSHGTVPTDYTRDNTVTKSSSTLTLGPFHSVPPTFGSSDSKLAKQAPFEVHFETRDPVIGLSKLVRTAEVSHWGGNMNIQDEMGLVNMGPKLKGHFSRLAHQQSRFHASVPAQILSELTLRLPPNARDVYFYDTIGNVSTSKFRAGSTPATTGKKSRTAPRLVDATLELRPRYPILGGWNYSFVVGWDTPLGDFLKVQGDRKVLAVPFLTSWKDMVVDDAEVRIILPEGAKNVEVITPFDVDSTTHSIHKTYLDSTGRHAITLKKAHCTEKHAQDVYVTYEYPNSALLQKPLTVAAVVMGVFILGSALRRVEWSIEAKKVL